MKKEEGKNNDNCDGCGCCGGRARLDHNKMWLKNGAKIHIGKSITNNKNNKN